MSIASSNLYYFVIVAKNDNPIYEAEFADSAKVPPQRRRTRTHCP